MHPPITPPQLPTVPVAPEALCLQCIHKLSQYICDLQTKGTASGWEKCAAVPKGLQMPSEEKPVDNQKPIEEGSDDWELQLCR